MLLAVENNEQKSHARVCFWSALIGLLNFVVMSGQCCASGPLPTWFAPSQQSGDFQQLFARPQSWAIAATQVGVISFSANYLTRASDAAVRQALAFSHDHGLLVDVSISALPVDKQICGDGVEGMVWPGEVALYAQKLRALGADVYSFSFDLPLTSGHLYHGTNACNFSVFEVASRIGTSVRALRQAYPNAKIFDAEVPTGMPPNEWLNLLSVWLSDFAQITGENFQGVSMDVWWDSPWKDAVQKSIRILHNRGISAGVFLDADSRNHNTAADWITAVKANACTIRKFDTPLDYVIIANWMAIEIKNLPDTIPLSLTSLIRWYTSEKSGC